MVPKYKSENQDMCNFKTTDMLIAHDKI